MIRVDRVLGNPLTATFSISEGGAASDNDECGVDKAWAQQESGTATATTIEAATIMAAAAKATAAKVAAAAARHSDVRSSGWPQRSAAVAEHGEQDAADVLAGQCAAAVPDGTAHSSGSEPGIKKGVGGDSAAAPAEEKVHTLSIL